MKFKDNQGNIYETENKFVIEQMEKSSMYKKAEGNKESTSKELTKAEIQAKLDELGIEYDNNATKATLLALLAQE